MKKTFIGLVIVISLLSCNERPDAGFSLIGKTHGIENGTVLYLRDVINNDLIDSVVVLEDSFRFQLTLPTEPLEVMLGTKDNTHYRYLWIEKKSMTFDATETDFRNAIVTGSETEELSQTLDRAIDTLSRKERLLKEQEFVDNNPNSIVSASILAVYSTTWGKKKTEELFNQFSEENKKSEYGKQISRYIDLNKDPQVGEAYVDFEMEDQNGNIKRLSATKGNVILLEFWSSWCGPCRQENPNLVKTYERFHPLGFEIFAVSLDESKESWLNAIEEDGLNWEHVSDLKGDVNTASLIYGISSIPDNFLIDENGIIIAQNLRGEKLTQRLKEILE